MDSGELLNSMLRGEGRREGEGRNGGGGEKGRKGESTYPVLIVRIGSILGFY